MSSTPLETANYTIQAHGYTSYLELGCASDVTFEHVICPRKVGVDCVKGGTIKMTTDDYFAKHDERFDMVFIDACHKHDFVMRDVRNSLKILSKGGIIMMHDCNPAIKMWENEDGRACGTAWRALVHLRMDADLDVIVSDYSHGTSLLRIGKNTNQLSGLKPMNELTYVDLDNNRSTWLNPRPWAEVKEWIGSTVVHP